MFTCPACGKHNVKFVHFVRMIEYWNDDDLVDSEEDLSCEREPESAELECMECGYSSDCIDEWSAS